MVRAQFLKQNQQKHVDCSCRVCSIRWSHNMRSLNLDATFHKKHNISYAHIVPTTFSVTDVSGRDGAVGVIASCSRRARAADLHPHRRVQVHQAAGLHQYPVQLRRGQRPTFRVRGVHGASQLTGRLGATALLQGGAVSAVRTCRSVLGTNSQHGAGCRRLQEVREGTQSPHEVCTLPQGCILLKRLPAS